MELDVTKFDTPSLQTLIFITEKEKKIFHKNIGYQRQAEVIKIQPS